jgi:hypothetical protein
MSRVKQNRLAIKGRNNAANERDINAAPGRHLAAVGYLSAAMPS